MTGHLSPLQPRKIHKTLLLVVLVYLSIYSDLKGMPNSIPKYNIKIIAGDMNAQLGQGWYLTETEMVST